MPSGRRAKNGLSSEFTKGLCGQSHSLHNADADAPCNVYGGSHAPCKTLNLGRCYSGAGYSASCQGGTSARVRNPRSTSFNRHTNRLLESSQPPVTIPITSSELRSEKIRDLITSSEYNRIHHVPRTKTPETSTRSLLTPSC